MPYDPRSRARVAKPRSATEAAPGAPPSVLADIAREPDPFARLMAMDERLQTSGFHPMSPWWKGTLRAFYASGKRWLVVLAGRGSGKSTTLTRVAAAETLFTPRKVPPGQRFAWPFVSVSMGDARARIIEIASILRAVGIEAEPSYPAGRPTIETEDAAGNAVAFVALAGTVAALSGPTALGATVDEEQKLRGSSAAANPAAELLASLMQTFRAKPGIRAIRCSSAWSAESTHAASVREGDTDATTVARLGTFAPVAVRGFLDVATWEEQAQRDRSAADTIRAYAAKLTPASTEIPTWVPNPSISAIDTRREVQALAQVPGGMSRTAYWMRENGSAIPHTQADDRAARARAAFAGFAEGHRMFSPSPFYDPRTDHGLPWRVDGDGHDLA